MAETSQDEPVVTINDIPYEVCLDRSESLRFKGNRIVKVLYDFAQRGMRLDLNMIECMWDDHEIFTREELCEFYRLIGFSVESYCDLPCTAPDEVACSLWKDEELGT